MHNYNYNIKTHLNNKLKECGWNFFKFIYRAYRNEKTIISDFSRLNYNISESPQKRNRCKIFPRNWDRDLVHQCTSPTRCRMQRCAVLAPLPPCLDGVQCCSAACRLQPLQPALHQAADQYLNGSDGWGDAAMLHTDTTHRHQARPTRLLWSGESHDLSSTFHLACILKNLKFCVRYQWVLRKVKIIVNGYL